jgi:hypothetical protein
VDERFERRRRAWQRAYTAYRDEGDDEHAARSALFLSVEYDESSRIQRRRKAGWRARNVSSRRRETTAVRGWLLVTRASRQTDPSLAVPEAAAALQLAERLRDADLELASLGALGLAEIRLGDVDTGLARFDEAMAAATGGEAADPRTLGDLYCSLVLAGEVTLDLSRLGQWTPIVMTFMNGPPARRALHVLRHVLRRARGIGRELEGGRALAVETLRTLEATGQVPRCVHPATRLAMLRVRQGRLEEAEHLLEGYEDLPEAVQPTVAIHLGRGRTSLAAARLQRRLNRARSRDARRRAVAGSARRRAARSVGSGRGP